MKKCLMLCLLVMLSPILARADEKTLLFNEPPISLSLIAVETGAGIVQLGVEWANAGDGDQRVNLIAPEYNGAPAGFDNGWNTEDFQIKPGARIQGMIVICSDDPGELPDTVSLRFADGDSVSSPLTLDVGSETQVLAWASFEEAVREPQVVSEALRVLAEPRPFVLSDHLAPDELALLDYGQAIVCYREIRDGETILMPFCAIRAEVDTDGNVQASYSGLAMTLDAAPDYPLYFVESTEADGSTLSASRIALSGDAIFFGDFSLEVRITPGQLPSLTRQLLETEEIGGQCTCVPCSLFNTLRSSQSIIKLVELGDYVYPDSIDNRSITLPVDAPLVLSLVQADSLGEVYTYFEYFFTDKNSTIHMPPRRLDN